MLSVELVGPDGAITWTCRKEGELLNVEPCVAPQGWHGQAGAYVALVTNKAIQGDHSSELKVDPEVADRALEWNALPTGYRLTRARPGDPSVRVKATQERLLGAEIVNGSKGTVDFASGSRSGVRVEQWKGDAWVPLRDDQGWARSDKPLGAGETRSASLYQLPRTLDAGRYRFVLGYTLPPPDGQRPREDLVRFEVVSEPFEHSPTVLAACAATDNEKAARLQPQKGPPTFRSLVSTSAGVLVLKNTGEVLRVDGKAPQVISKVGPGSFLHIIDAQTLIAWGDQAMISRNGGRSFSDLSALDPLLQIAAAGSRLFAFSVDGRAGWMDDQGGVSPVKLPVAAAWRAAAFKDEKHGVLLGDCSVMAETEDGAAWTVRGAPGAFPFRAQWEGGDLFVDAGRGVFRRRAGGEAFELVVPDTGCRMQSGPDVLMCGTGRLRVPHPETLPSFPPKPGQPFNFKLPVVSEEYSLFERDKAGRYMARTVKDPEGRFPRFARAKDGTLFGLYSSPSQVVRFKGSEPVVILKEEDPKPVAPHSADPRKASREKHE